MNNRREFLIQGSLAATAMFVLDPLKSFAGTTSTSGNNNRLVFLHTSNLHPIRDQQVIDHINKISSKNANTILLKAVPGKLNEITVLNYDAAFCEGNEQALFNYGYKIIDKDNLRTGIINASPDEKNIIEKTKLLATYLKKEKKCAVVVCLSQLGYKNTNAPDDIMLASQSTDIDIIIGGHPENFHQYPIIALNSNNAEVIIHAAADNNYALGKIEIDFDGKGRKKQVRFADHS